MIADGINRAIQSNPSTVFLIEGHTDAVGDDVDNLSLSDRRAEIGGDAVDAAVRRACGKSHVAGLRRAVSQVPVDGPERRNRRVTVRNITPLLNGGEANAAPR